ncbi:MAG TPA: hypothetical protein DCM32_01490 [Xanthomonadaceae bacterium]|jgi:copper homeostasis protein (lipoprotein)|nr:hypothetical protein [Xanthomonadaceae bacterium]
MTRINPWRATVLRGAEGVYDARMPPPLAPVRSRRSGPVVAAGPVSVLLVASMLLAGCAGDGNGDAAGTTPVPAAPTLAPLPNEFEGDWRGVLPCTDCDGIEVELTLRRDGDGATFALIERYLAADQSAEFRSEGAWQEAPCGRDGEAGLCVLLVDAGQRWRRDKDGSLQAVDADGQPIDADGARLSRR